MTMHKCNLCDYKNKRKNTLKQHERNVHKIGVQWVYCDVGKCEYKCLHNDDIIQHKQYIHNIAMNMIIDKTSGNLIK